MIARTRGQHLLVINEDFHEDRNSTSTEKFSNLVISDMSPNEAEKTNITLLFAGLKSGIDGLRSISHAKTDRVTGEFRTAKDEEEGSASLVIQNPVEFARKYILWAKCDEGLIEDYNLEPSKSIPSPDKSYKEWGNLSSLNQQLFPLSDHSIEFIWEHLINQNPRGFIDFIRRLLDKSLCPEKTNPASRIQDLHDSDLNQNWGTSVGDAFRDSVSYIFHFMYGSDSQAKSYRKIFKIDKWKETNEISDISSLDPPPLDPPQPDTIQELMNKWNLGGPDKESILPKVHELEYTVWESILSRFFNYNGGINYEHPYLKKRLLTRNFNFIKSRSNTAHNATFTEWGLNLDDYATDYLEHITTYRRTVITIGKHLEDNEGKWPELAEHQDVISEIVEIISHYTKITQEKLQRNIKFEDLENMLMSFKIFEGMWRSLLNREKISFTPKADEVEARFNKSWKMRTVGILDQLENSLQFYPEMGQVMGKAKDLNATILNLKQKAVDETDLIAEIFRYRVRDDIWWKSFSSTSGWSDSLSLSNWGLNQNIDNWNIFANRKGTAKGQLSFWYNFHITFSSQWFSATQVPSQDITRNARILFKNYKLIKEDKDNLESTIQSLQGSEEQEIKNKWDTIKNLDLDFIINKTTDSYMFDERGLTNENGIKFLVSYIFSLEESSSLFNFWNYCNAASLNKQKLDPHSQDTILQSWDERRKSLSKGQSISVDLNKIIVPVESENQDTIRLTSLLTLIKEGEESLEEIKKKILLCHISEILFDKDVKQKDLSSTLDSSEDEFDEDELIKYARVLASFQFKTDGKDNNTYDELPDSKSKLKILNKINSSDLENVTEAERFFFDVQIFHNHFKDIVHDESLWSKALNAVFNNKTLFDMPQSQLKELQEEYGDVLTLEFKKSN